MAQNRSMRDDTLDDWSNSKYYPFANLDVSEVPVEEQLEKMQKFVVENRNTLNEVEFAITEHIIDIRETIFEPIGIFT